MAPTRLLGSLALLATSVLVGPALGQDAFVNGLWFDGQRFVGRTAYAIDGRLTFVRPATVARTIDLAGGYVVPPFAEAHNHNLITASLADAMIPRYLAEGVFYAKMQSNLPRLSDPIRDRFNRPTSVDVMFANGPLTATGGHPVALREQLVERGVYPGFTKATLENQGYVLINSAADIESKWPMILSMRPDFIKAVLVFSEEFERRRDDTAYFGRKGLDPKLLPRLVARAHASGLRVSVHTNTATDFHYAVTAGADEIAHLPGYFTPSLIAEADARRAAERGISVVTTVSLAVRRRDQAELYQRIREAQAANLRLLHRHGVQLTIGSDDVEQTSTGEVRYLQELGVFDNLTLLKMWSENAARTIFPNRRIGALQEGYEASFLVLEGDPIKDFVNTGKIRLRFKQGVQLP
jgi:predicted amidohydrolase YtcJ